MKNINPPPINLITSDQSDIDSQSSHQKMEIQEQSKKTQQDMYEKFNNSTYFKLTDSLKAYAREINDFLQDQKYILFIFGPSGSGKTSLVRKILHYNQLQYQQVEQHYIETKPGMGNQSDSDGAYEYQGYQNERLLSLGDSILETMQKVTTNTVYVCYNFPITVERSSLKRTEAFKRKFVNQIETNRKKFIFILNDEIYNRYYVLNQRASDKQNINKSEYVKVIKMKKYMKTQMQKILKGFIEDQKLYEYFKFVNNKTTLDEIIELSNGDLRKALTMIYWRKIQENAQMFRAIQKKKMKNFQQSKNIVDRKQTTINTLDQISLDSNENKSYEAFRKYIASPFQRVALYHGLGKFLYGKRLNVIKQIQGKNKKQISCYYTQKQIKQLDPPFYFDPFSVFQQLKISLSIVVDLLQQNYLARFGKIKDVRQMSEIFRDNDSFFSYRNCYQDQDVNTLKIELITWGMLIYNRNSRTDNQKFGKFQKSQCSSVAKKVRQKKQLVRNYFKQSNLDDLIKFAQITQNVYPKLLLNEVIFSPTISKQIKTNVDEDMKVINQEQEEELETVLKCNSNQLEKKLKNMVLQKQKKRIKMEELSRLLEDDDQSDELVNSSDDQQ